METGQMDDANTHPEADSPPRLSVVIPAFNEAQRLPESLARLRAYLDATEGVSEVVVVNDGSTDDTADVLRAWATRWPALRAIDGPHQGKGGAVRAGILAAHGEYVALADADFSMPPEQFARFAVERLGAYDLAIGSREATGARRYDEPRHRHLMGRVFNLLVRVALIPNIEDTQCGFKVLRRAVAVPICQQQTVLGWGFDVEMLYIARRWGCTVVEVPIDWYYNAGSRISPLRDTLTMVRDVLSVRLNSLRGRYSRRLPPPEQRPVLVGGEAGAPGDSAHSVAG